VFFLKTAMLIFRSKKLGKIKKKLLMRQKMTM